jgi:uncharacterized membrane protein YphA (DoxX/SURF4 family)
VSLVALRFVIGFHFYREGADKIVSGNFSSAGFMRIAKGPFAPVFRAMIWDGEGRARLDKEATLERWNQYRQQVVDHYGFDQKQAVEAEKKLTWRAQQLESLFDDNAEDINKYLNGLDRLERYRVDSSRMGVASLRGQVDQIEQELYMMRGPWLGSINSMWAGLEEDLNGLATEEQAKRGRLAIGKPGRQLMDTVFIDKIIPGFDLLVGLLLMVGLFTRLTALAGAGFLAMIIATQWPGAPGAQPAHYQAVEMVALLVLAAVGAGRFAGLDFLVNHLRLRCFPPKTEKR